MKRALILIFAAAVLAGPAGSFAAGLGGIGGTLGSGGASVAACDADFGTVYTTVSGNVTAVQVAGISGACAGGALSVTLANAAGTAIGSGGPATISGATSSVAISATPDADLVAGLRVSIEGP
jgi:hypothetical protein